MPRVKKRKAACQDLAAQYEWYAEHASVEVADRFASECEATLRMLAQFPSSGTPLPSRGMRLKDVRRCPAGGAFERILIVYRPIKGGIELIRVVHASRHLAALVSRGFLV